MLSTDTLIQTAHDTYGELIELIVVYPQGINVQLIGFECAIWSRRLIRRVMESSHALYGTPQVEGNGLRLAKVTADLKKGLTQNFKF